MSNLVKQKCEIAGHLHQMVDLLICQLLNLQMKQHTVSHSSQPESSVHSQRVNKPPPYSSSFQNRDEGTSQSANDQ